MVDKTKITVLNPKTPRYTPMKEEEYSDPEGKTRIRKVRVPVDEVTVKVGVGEDPQKVLTGKKVRIVVTDENGQVVSDDTLVPVS